MSFRFSNRSAINLSELHPLLRNICNDAIREFDFCVLDGSRNRAEQEKAFAQGNSKAHFGQSAHNWRPAIAMDIAPYPISFDFKAPGVKDSWLALGRIILDVAKHHSTPIRWGADWNMNGSVTDETFLDWGHFELFPWKEWAHNQRAALNTLVQPLEA